MVEQAKRLEHIRTTILEPMAEKIDMDDPKNEKWAKYYKEMQWLYEKNLENYMKFQDVQDSVRELKQMSADKKFRSDSIDTARKLNAAIKNLENV